MYLLLHTAHSSLKNKKAGQLPTGFQREDPTLINCNLVQTAFSFKIQRLAGGWGWAEKEIIKTLIT